MGRENAFLQTAEALKPALFERVARPLQPAGQSEFCRDGLSKGMSIRLDFGEHLVGFPTLRFGYTGSHPDAPAWLRLKFAQRECELSEHPEQYHGWISAGWIQQEQIHIDVLPARVKLPRRYAFRYLEIEVLDVSSKYRLTLEDAFCTAVTSADERRLEPFPGPAEDARLDQVACRTLRDCMQEVFEDGPKRDRRLWIGDLRLQALANYETYRNYDLVKRCLYLFAGATREDGRVSACLFTQPDVEADDTVMFDYSLFFIPTLLDYYHATGDRQTLLELAPTAWRQIDLSQSCFTDGRLVMDSDVLGWCFVDWNLRLNKQASAQGIYLYCLRAAIELARILGETGRAARLCTDYDRKQGAAELLWDAEKGFYISGADHQVSWASQVWMVLGGAAHGDGALLRRLETCAAAEKMITPYMYHNYVDALLHAGETDRAFEVLRTYWGGMLARGADTFWELYNPENPEESPYGGTIVNSYCHAWSCAPAYFLRRYDRRRN